MAVVEDNEDRQELSVDSMAPLSRFAGRAEAYARYRPEYPPAAISAILAGLSDLGSRYLADIGAGTGIAARQLAAQGINVLAIEPNLEMQAMASPHPRLQFHPGQAEQTGLATASVERVTAFQAFHWFKPTAALAEFQRILKPGGRLAVVWNNRDRQDPFTAAYSQLLRQSSGQHPAQEWKALSHDFFTDSPFVLRQQLSFPNPQRLDWAALVGRTDSLSYIPKAGPTRDRLLEDLQHLYQQYNCQGWVELVHSTDLYLADRLDH